MCIHEIFVLSSCSLSLRALKESRPEVARREDGDALALAKPLGEMHADTSCFLGVVFRTCH